MEVIPAVDIMNGRVVRLLRGDPRLVSSYEHLGDPVSLARRWEGEGAGLIHVVDLDAALGLGRNLDVIESLVRSVGVPVQVGGGIRSLDMARRMFSIGVERVIIGSLAFSDPAAVRTLVREAGAERIVVALDNLGGAVMIRGWKKPAGITVDEAARRFRSMGIKSFLVTSVRRDGTLSGPDLETLSRLCRAGFGVIAAGGIKSIGDLLALKRIGVQGAIIGKALYEGRFSLSEALRAVSGE
jgi:phosphoribosylformimino-5-aminoimidazole carboxamide ribotide isomerase